MDQPLVTVVKTLAVNQRLALVHRRGSRRRYLEDGGLMARSDGIDRRDE